MYLTERVIGTPSTAIENKPNVGEYTYPLIKGLQEFLIAGNYDIQPEVSELEAVGKVMADIFEQDPKAAIVGKLSFCAGLSMAGYPNIFGLNNQLRNWVSFNGFTGDLGCEVQGLESVLNPFGEEWAYPTSDVDIKTIPEVIARLKDYVGSYGARDLLMTAKTEPFVIPSRGVEGTSLDFYLSDGTFDLPFLRLNCAPRCNKAGETAIDRRWAGVNRIQEIHARVASGGGITIATDNVNLLKSQPDSYYPKVQDNLDKVVVTTSRMLLYAALRKKAGFLVHNHNELISPDSIRQINHYFINNKGSGVKECRVLEEWNVNMTLLGVLDPSLFTLLPEMGVLSVLPEHWQKAKWKELNESTIGDWNYGGESFNTQTKLADLVEQLSGASILATNQIFPSVERNQKAMNWIFSGCFH